MNKAILLCSVLIVCIFFNLGITIRKETLGIMNQKKVLESAISDLQSEHRDKTSLIKKQPKTIAEAFSRIINEMNTMNAYSGFDMEFVIPLSKGRNNFDDMCTKTEFRRVKGVSLDIRVLKTAEIADVGSVLDSIYLLEDQTDFKVNEISQDSQEIRVKGLLYGI